jgi:hypothetical protein
LVIKNTGEMEFKYRIVAVDSKPFDINNFTNEMLSLQPKSGIIYPHHSATIVIQYFSGIIGEVNKTLYLEVSSST